MGTSKSSKGSPGGVPMVPPWTPDPALPPAVPPAAPPDPNQDPAKPEPAPVQPAPKQAPVPIAPAGRFQTARLSLGKFASSGSSGDMRRGVGRYVRKGLGGAATATRRLGGTASVAGALYRSLSDLAAGTPTAAGGLDRNLLAGRSASEICNQIVEAVRPVDGTQDAEASRSAIQESLSQLLAAEPDADLLNLSDEQRWAVVEGFLSADIYKRINLDLGQTIQNKAPTLTVALQRLSEIKAYVQQTVAAEIRKVHKADQIVTQSQTVDIIRRTIQQTLTVFEGYAE